MLVQLQLSSLKEKYAKSDPEAQQLFLQYLGTAAPSDDGQLEALKAEYESQIAGLNGTISAQQQQLDGLTAEMTAACDTRVASLQEEMTSTCDSRVASLQEEMTAACDTQVASLQGQMTEACDTRLAVLQQEMQTASQQQINELIAAHQSELEALTNQLNTECDLRLEQAYTEWQATAGSQDSDTLEQSAVFSTNDISPFAIAGNASGNIYVLDRAYLSVTTFSQAGDQLSQWTPGTLSLPVDMDVDSQDNIFVLDQQAAVPLQKFASDGTPLAFSVDSSQIVYPMGLFIDSNDTIYVTDAGGVYGGGRVLTFNAAGELLNIFSEAPDLAFEEFRDITVDESAQAVYVVTSTLVAKFDLSGNYIESWSGDFRSPNGIAIGPQGDILIADTYSNEIDQYDSAGTFKTSMAEDAYRPYHIATDASGNLLVADHGNRRVIIFN